MMISIGARVVCHAFVSERDNAALTGCCPLMVGDLSKKQERSYSGLQSPLLGD